MVLANPRVTSAAAGARVGQAGRVPASATSIRPSRKRPKRCMMVARDLAVGKRKRSAREPDRHHRARSSTSTAPTRSSRRTDRSAARRRTSSACARTPQGLDLNRDAVKLETVEANGLYRLLNDWDPVLLLDGHLMSRVNHGYANTYGTTTVPAAAPGPRDYTHDTLFPGRARHGAEATSASRCSRTRCSTPEHVAADGVEPRPRRLDRRSEVHRQRLRPAQPPRDHHRDAGPADVRAAHLRAVRLPHRAARVHQRAREGDAGRRQGGRRRDRGRRAGAAPSPAQLTELPRRRVPVARQDRRARRIARTSPSTGPARAS